MRDPKMKEGRADPRQTDRGAYRLTWTTRDGLTHSAQARGCDRSESGVRLECSSELNPGSLVYLLAGDGSVEGECVVVYCERAGQVYRIGLEFRDVENHTRPFTESTFDSETDYYEILQISPKADIQTIQRVFRMMAARFHPDNPETGNVEEFLRLKKAHAVLSDPERRAEYDAIREARENEPMPIFELKEFVTGVEAESNRRMGVLSLLYNKRRSSPDHPGVSLLELEQRMGFPREYLSFTIWYLRAKEFVTVADNSDYAITAAGADHVERKAARSDIVGKLLKAGVRRGDADGKSREMKPKGSASSKRRFLLGAVSDGAGARPAAH